MLGTDEILHALRVRGIRNQELAQVLNLSNSRITELYNGKRKLSHDEAHRLAEHYGLEQPAVPASPLSLPVARLLARHAAMTLDVEIHDEDPRLGDLAQDFVIFSQYAADPQVRDRVESAEGFFLALKAMKSPGARTSELRVASGK